MRVLVLAFLALAASSAAAQPSLPVGKPMPDASLADGTLVVLVIDGQLTARHANMMVTLTVNGKERTSTTDTNGRATFDKVAAAAKVRARIVVGGKVLDTDELEMPATHGVRLLLSTK